MIFIYIILIQSEILIIVASISTEKDKYLDKAMELDEEIQNIFLSTVDKYIDFNKEDGPEDNEENPEVKHEVNPFELKDKPEKQEKPEKLKTKEFEKVEIEKRDQNRKTSIKGSFLELMEDSEVKDHNVQRSKDRQQSLKKKEEEKGSFFGLLLEGRGNKFLDPNPQANRNIENLKKDKEQLLNDVKNLNDKIELMAEMINEGDQKLKMEEGIQQEKNMEIEFLKTQIKNYLEEKEVFMKFEREITALKDVLAQKDIQLDKLHRENKIDSQHHLDEMDQLKVIIYKVYI